MATASSSFPTASSSFPAERARERSTPIWDPDRDRDEAVRRQIQGVLRRGAPDPDISWRAVWKRMLLFVLVMALLLFGGSLFGG